MRGRAASDQRVSEVQGPARPGPTAALEVLLPCREATEQAVAARCYGTSAFRPLLHLGNLRPPGWLFFSLPSGAHPASPLQGLRLDEGHGESVISKKPLPSTLQCSLRQRNNDVSLQGQGKYWENKINVSINNQRATEVGRTEWEVEGRGDLLCRVSTAPRGRVWQTPPPRHVGVGAVPPPPGGSHSPSRVHTSPCLRAPASSPRPGLLSNNKASTLVFSLFESKRFISYS